MGLGGDEGRMEKVWCSKCSKVHTTTADICNHTPKRSPSALGGGWRRRAGSIRRHTIALHLYIHV